MMNVTEDVTKMDITMDTSTCDEEPMSSTSNQPRLSSTVVREKDQTALVISSDDDEDDDDATKTSDKSTNDSSLVCLGDKEETMLSGLDDDTDEFDMESPVDQAETMTPITVVEETTTEEKVSPARSVSPPPRLPTPKFTKVNVNSTRRSLTVTPLFLFSHPIRCPSLLTMMNLTRTRSHSTSLSRTAHLPMAR